MEGWTEIKGFEVVARKTGKWTPALLDMKARGVAYVAEYGEWWSGFILNPGKGSFIFRPDMKHCPY